VEIIVLTGEGDIEEDAKKISKHQAYNILPMEEDGVSNPFNYFSS
jgi:hypothetical protein